MLHCWYQAVKYLADPETLLPAVFSSRTMALWINPFYDFFHFFLSAYVICVFPFYLFFSHPHGIKLVCRETMSLTRTLTSCARCLSDRSSAGNNSLQICLCANTAHQVSPNNYEVKIRLSFCDDHVPIEMRVNHVLLRAYFHEWEMARRAVNHLLTCAGIFQRVWLSSMDSLLLFDIVVFVNTRYPFVNVLFIDKVTLWFTKVDV